MSAILVLDTETTGLDPQDNRLTEIAAKLYVEGKEVEGATFSQKVSVNDGTVSLAALKVNGISITSLSSYGVHESIAIATFFEYLTRLSKKHPDLTLCGMNVAFDVAFIKAAAKRYGIKDVEAVLPRKVVDTQIIAQALRLAGILDTKDIKSETLYKAFDIETKDEKLHTAIVDVEKTAQLYFKLEFILKN